MPPRRLKRRGVERMVQKWVAKAIAEYERNRTNPENAGGSGPANAGGVVAPDVHGCSYKTFRNCQPHSFNGTEGVVGLTRWFEKMEQVFEISKCVEEDKVKFAACTFEGRALTWWNGNVHTDVLSLYGIDSLLGKKFPMRSSHATDTSFEISDIIFHIII
ncbi:hypothetical protein Tco_0865982 [Tanacetum coccineum]